MTTIPPIVRRVLAARAISDLSEVERFAAPSLHHLHPPGLMPNIDRAAQRMLDSLDAPRGPLVIYGDYDVDGITATAILFHIMKSIAPDADVRTYVPHRLSEGYGLNVEAIEELAASGADLVVSVDCGVTAHEPASRAKALGLDLIITDHHNPPASGDPLPDAFAIVHPRLPGSDYPYGDLCGAGVAFKLAWRLATLWCNSERVTKTLQQLLIGSLAFAALGTIADVVPLVDENRVIARFGLQVMRGTSFVGLNALIQASGLADGKVDSDAVGFRLAPRLNACGRMGHAREAVRLFTDATPDEAETIARELNRQNQQRQTTERSIFKTACDLAADGGMTGDDRRIIVLADPEWHPGVVGIVCSRLVERFGRPAILMQRCDDVCKGSARSIDGYSIHAALVAVSDHLDVFGGHDMAAGLSVLPARFDGFVAALTEHANANIPVEELTPALTIDCEAELDEFTEQSVRGLESLAPFGRGNSAPALLVRGARIAEPPRTVGAEGKHLSLRVKQPSGAWRQIKLIGWSMGRFAPQLANGMNLDVVIRPKLNEWNGRTYVEGELQDLRAVNS